jgi:hypothetical protein
MSRSSVVVATVASVVSVASLSVAYVALKRTGPTGDGEYSRLTLAERVDRVELERMHFSVFMKHQETEMRAMERIEERMTLVESRTEAQIAIAANPPLRARPRAEVTPTTTMPDDRAVWWCHFGRECFRGKERCTRGEEARAAECKPTKAAWCGGKDGADCFVNLRDCITHVSTLGKFNGHDLTFDADVKQNCVGVH